MGCGKRAAPKTGVGAERLTDKQLREFITEHAPADVAMMVSSAKNRVQLCVILGLFPEGRELKGGSSSGPSSSSSSSNNEYSQMMRELPASHIKGKVPSRYAPTTGMPFSKKIMPKLNRKLKNVFNPRKYNIVPLNYRHMVRREARMKAFPSQYKPVSRATALNRLRGMRMAKKWANVSSSSNGNIIKVDNFDTWPSILGFYNDCGISMHL